ncbi:hypothetical protein EDB81DRAFT_927963 [Dactylonectria macrodidyma]|uniref:2EXR domain-containing protein n=1 Tax=Dactylonectria macrodidyma TaxID=307937 RepID=A0A9P9J871_9HYPO|nr:hypothetical protein EDB81DRAFT_927963 [Dactylonectria macrodidyma]
MTSDTHEVDALEAPIHFLAFYKLPAELRWKIWQMAICTDETPRIHYYSLFNTDEKGSRQSSLQQMLRTYPPKPSQPNARTLNGNWWTPSQLQSQPSQCSWTEANRFLYLWDAGLLNACKESRAALLQHLDKAPKRPSPKHSDMITAHHQGQHIYLRVISIRDIVCFRFAPEDMAKCASFRWDVLLSRLPFFHLPQTPNINLALEFDESWVEGIMGTTIEPFLKCVREGSPRGLALRAYWAWKRGLIPRRARMWLIDRGGRLPANYKVSGGLDQRYFSHYDEVLCEPENHHIFIDGKDKYVESYMWDGQPTKYGYNWDSETIGFRYMGTRSHVPVLAFMWMTNRWFMTARDGVFRKAAGEVFREWDEAAIAGNGSDEAGLDKDSGLEFFSSLITTAIAIAIAIAIATSPSTQDFNNVFLQSHDAKMDSLSLLADVAIDAAPVAATSDAAAEATSPATAASPPAAATSPPPQAAPRARGPYVKRYSGEWWDREISKAEAQISKKETQLRKGGRVVRALTILNARLNAEVGALHQFVQAARIEIDAQNAEIAENAENAEDAEDESEPEPQSQQQQQPSANDSDRTISEDWSRPEIL